MPAAALQNIDKEDDSAERKDDFGAADYRRTLELKADHTSRPLWIVCFISYAIYYFMDFYWQLFDLCNDAYSTGWLDLSCGKTVTLGMPWKLVSQLFSLEPVCFWMFMNLGFLF